MKCLNLSRKFGIAALAILAALVPLSVLANGDSDTGSATDQEQTSTRPFWGLGWLVRGHVWGVGGIVERIAEKLGATDEELQEATVQVIVEDMTDALGLDETEVAEITPIIEDIYSLREQLKTKHEELDAVIGDKLDAYRESMAGSWGFHRMRGMLRMRGGMRGMWGCPQEVAPDEESAE